MELLLEYISDKLGMLACNQDKGLVYKYEVWPDLRSITIVQNNRRIIRGESTHRV